MGPRPSALVVHEKYELDLDPAHSQKYELDHRSVPQITGKVN